jgi:hypothetical protein
MGPVGGEEEGPMNIPSAGARALSAPLFAAVLILLIPGCGGQSEISSPSPTPQPSTPTLSAAFVMTAPSAVSPMANLTTITFDGSSSVATGTTIASYAWTFGDGSSATGASAVHQYDSGGTFTATLTIGGGGVTATASRSVPVATLTGSWSNTYQGQTRTLRLNQSGSMHSSSVFLTGTYTNTGLAGQVFNVEGTLGPDPERAILISAKNLDEPAVFELHGNVAADAGSFTGLVTVGGASGQTLTFTPVR